MKDQYFSGFLILLNCVSGIVMLWDSPKIKARRKEEKE